MISETPFNPPRTDLAYAGESDEKALALVAAFPERMLERLPYCPRIVFGLVPDTVDIALIEKIGHTPGSLVSMSNLRHFSSEDRLKILRHYRTAIDNMITFVEFASRDK